MLLKSKWFEVELRVWSVYVRIGRREAYLCRGLSSVS